MPEHRRNERRSRRREEPERSRDHRDHNDGQPPAGESSSRQPRERRHRREGEEQSREHRQGGGEGPHRSRSRREQSHHRRHEQGSSSRPRSASHLRRKDSDSVLVSMLKWAAGVPPAPRNDRRYYESRKRHTTVESSSRSRRHREHTETRARSLDRGESRDRERRSEREQMPPRRHRSTREHRSDRQHRSQEHRSGRERESREQRSDPGEERRDGEPGMRELPRRDREARHRQTPPPEAQPEPMSEKKKGKQKQVVTETDSAFQQRMYKEVAADWGFELKTEVSSTVPQATHAQGYARTADNLYRQFQHVEEDNPYGDYSCNTWAAQHRAPGAPMDVPRGPDHTRDLIRERMARRRLGSLAEAGPSRSAAQPSREEEPLSPKSKPCKASPPPPGRADTSKPVSPLARKRDIPNYREAPRAVSSSTARPGSNHMADLPSRPESFWPPLQPTHRESPVPRPASAANSTYVDESVHSLEDPDEEMAPGSPADVHRRPDRQPPPPAMLNPRNLKRLSTNLPYNTNRTPSRLDYGDWRPSSSVYSQDPPRPVEPPTELNIPRAEIECWDSVSHAETPRDLGRSSTCGPAPARGSGPRGRGRGSVAQRGGGSRDAEEASYAGTVWPATPRAGAREQVHDLPVVAPEVPRVPMSGMIGGERTAIPVQRRSSAEPPPLRKKKGGLMGKLQKIF